MPKAKYLIGFSLIFLLLVLLHGCTDLDPISERVSIELFLADDDAPIVEGEPFTLCVALEAVAFIEVVHLTSAEGSPQDTVLVSFKEDRYRDTLFVTMLFDSPGKSAITAVAQTTDGSTKSTKMDIEVHAFAPEIVNHPEEVFVLEGDSAVFSVNAEGSKLSFQWQENGEDIEGATLTELIIRDITSAYNGNLYSCVVSNALGSETTDAALLTVVYKVVYNSSDHDEGKVPVDNNLYQLDEAVVVLGNNGELRRDGFAFSGWIVGFDSSVVYNEEDSLTMGEETINLFALWEANDLTVTFDPQNGEDVFTVAIASGETVDEPETPVRQGYEFNSWYSDEDLTELWDFSTPVSEDITLYAKWTPDAPQTYTLSYTAGENGSLTGETSQTVEHGESGTAVTAVPDEGYEFSEWSDGRTYNPRTDTNVQDHISVTAQFEAIPVVTFTVTFQSNDGSAVDGIEVEGGETVSEPEEPTRDGYTFDGWYADEELTKLWDFSQNTVKESITLYAKWTPDAPQTYTLSYTAGENGSLTGETSQTVEHGESGTAVTAVPDEGYEFSEWSDGRTYNPRTDANVQDHISVTAQFEAIPVVTFTVTFQSNDGSAVDGIEVEGGETVSEPEEPTRDGYTFDGWYADEELTELWDFSQSTVSEDITLYAKWTPIPVFTLTYHSNGNDGGTAPTTASYEEGQEVTVSGPGSLYLTGYTFSGWNTQADGQGDAYDVGDTFEMGSENMELYAQWEIKVYIVSFETYGGSDVDTQHVQHGSLATEPSPAPVKDGHTFVEWCVNESLGTVFDFQDVRIYGNRTIYAKWSINPYTITFDKNHGDATGSMSSQTMLFGNPTPLSSGEFERTDYTFLGWSTTRDGSVEYEDNSEFTIGSANVTLYAVWEWAGTLTDIDGNVYTTVRIGNQIWTVENLRTTRYADGTPIPHVIDNSEWGDLSTPAYCWYDDGGDVSSQTDYSHEKYGALYNWWVVDPSNPKNIAPEGWRVPTDEDWTELQNYLIANGYNWDSTTTGNKIGKALASDGGEWDNSTDQGRVGNDQRSNNSSGFTGLPGGFRASSGDFLQVGGSGIWWSSTEFGTSALYRVLLGEGLSRTSFSKASGYSVRLLRD
ncbi:hypothetical protein CHISP_2664 [Chitinispirillum alkaliphilum]|nr:hypothetical protein CHISP_2664 [Chitinispirillum alkaliphilum]